MSKVTVFERALVDAVLCEYIDIPNSTEIQYEPSEKFKDAIKKIVAGFGKHRIVTITVIKRLLLVAIIAALLTGCALAIPAVREYLIEFFLNDHGSWYGVTFDPEAAKDAPREIEAHYTLTYVPIGYKVGGENRSRTGGDIFFMNEKGSIIAFCQSLIPINATQDDWIGINADNTTRTSLVIDGYLVEYIIGERFSSCVWTNNQYLFLLDCDISVSQEDIVKIIENIAIIPSKNLVKP